MSLCKSIATLSMAYLDDEHEQLPPQLVSLGRSERNEPVANE